ncbi:MAG: PD-(D/E)XK nuclease family protein [Alistipes sp.]|nr:PD-(D/E)XK nuclease family protein [Alistipes sp.]
MGKSFLQELAERLLERYSGDLSRLIILFPSLRARTFFNSALAALSSRPVWQPKWMSVDELMERASGLVRGERIRLISELYKIYVKYHPTETFDKFYFWGEMLIADFDLIDKYQVDASQLLRNLEDIKELEADVSYLTPEQLRIISFWKSIGDSDSLSEQKQRFLKIWRSLPMIYTEFRARLASLGFAYAGMIYRTAVERIARGDEVDLPKGRYVVAGFNALSSSEKQLFDYLSHSDEGAEFYWDYDSYYTQNRWHEAGEFMRENIVSFPATESISTDNFTKIDKQIRSIACVSNVVQCKYAAELLERLGAESLDKRTAIVLTDENMLVPMLHSLPKSVDKVNVTMGYPLKITLVNSLIERLVELQSHGRVRGDVAVFYHVDVLGLLSHPYVADSVGKDAKRLYDHIVANRMVSIEETLFADSDILKVIFSKRDSWQRMAKYLLEVLTALGDVIAESDKTNCEYINIAYDEISKMMLAVERCEINPSVEVFISLVRRHLQSVTIPYEGEPLEGVQIMGILETRNVDFENVIILSMTDTSFPSDKTGQPSFIPYNLRAAYGLPTPEQHEAMYAYYFYRLIQRAKSVSMLYCSRADDKSTGECSRYIYQLEYESPYPIEKLSVGVDLGVEEVAPIVVEKGDYEQQMLARYLAPDEEHSLSPTALFRYIECPLKFYLHSVAKLKPQDEISDTIDALTFGNILHETMQELYTPLVGVKNPMSAISKLRKRQIVEEAVNSTIARLLHGGKSLDDRELSGDTILVRDIIVKYIMRGILRYDSSVEGFTITGLEDEVKCRYPISSGRNVNLSGRADRIDTLPDGTLQIIDYKSGNVPHLEFNGVSNLFTGTANERISNIFQTLLYSMMLHRTEGVESLPTLYFASKMLADDYSPKLCDKMADCFVERYSDYAEEFERELSSALEQLFNYDEPFRQTEDVDMCKYCDFKSICRR